MSVGDGAPAAGAGDGRPVDYRFLLANERTFLAYLRTGLSLQIVGLAVLEFLADARAWPVIVLGAALIVVGSAMAVAGYRRWRSNDSAIRRGAELDRTMTPSWSTVAVALVPVAIAVVLLAA